MYFQRMLIVPRWPKLPLSWWSNQNWFVWPSPWERHLVGLAGMHDQSGCRASWYVLVVTKMLSPRRA